MAESKTLPPGVREWCALVSCAQRARCAVYGSGTQPCASDWQNSRKQWHQTRSKQCSMLCSHLHSAKGLTRNVGEVRSITSLRPLLCQQHFGSNAMRRVFQSHIALQVSVWSDSGYRRAGLDCRHLTPCAVVQWVAWPHSVKATGYKAKNAYGHSPVFPSDTCALSSCCTSMLLDRSAAAHQRTRGPRDRGLASIAIACLVASA